MELNSSQTSTSLVNTDHFNGSKSGTNNHQFSKNSNAEGYVSQHTHEDRELESCDTSKQRDFSIPSQALERDMDLQTFSCPMNLQTVNSEIEVDIEEKDSHHNDSSIVPSNIGKINNVTKLIQSPRPNRRKPPLSFRRAKRSPRPTYRTLSLTPPPEPINNSLSDISGNGLIGQTDGLLHNDIGKEIIDFSMDTEATTKSGILCSIMMINHICFPGMEISTARSTQLSKIRDIQGFKDVTLNEKPLIIDESISPEAQEISTDPSSG